MCPVIYFKLQALALQQIVAMTVSAGLRCVQSIAHFLDPVNEGSSAALP